MNLEDQIGQKTGREFWQSLEELSKSDAFTDAARDEFMAGASDASTLDRREFLRLMSASLALAGMQACQQKAAEKIVPYVKEPERIVPGKPLYFATSMTLGGYATGFLATSFMGRPTKLDGNTLHPASQGASDSLMQAAILNLYDPDRSQGVMHMGRVSTWEAFAGAMRGYLEAHAAAAGAGLRVLSEAISSPTLLDLRARFLKKFPRATWVIYEPLHRDALYEGTRLAFNTALEPLYDLKNAGVVVAVGGDLFSDGPARLKHIHDFAVRRRVFEKDTRLNRVYAVEATPTLLGARADHRTPLHPHDFGIFLQALAARVGVAGFSKNPPPGVPADLLDQMAADLLRARGSSLVVVGETQDPALQALAHKINDHLGNIGKTVSFIDPVLVDATEQTQAIQTLMQDLEQGKVETLVMLGGNPVYNAPNDLRFAQAMQKAKQRIHLGAYEDETSALCQWHVGESHFLETWGDGRAFDGTLSLQQPLIDPLYATKSALEFTALMLGENAPSYDLIRRYWQSEWKGVGFESTWRRAVHDGVVVGTAFKLKSPAARTPALLAAKDKALVVEFSADPFIYDGRFANNGWLQETPRPLTKITWDNVALISPETAKRLGLSSGEQVDLQTDVGNVRAPIWIMPGQADDVITVALGFGRKQAGRVAENVGFNAYVLRGLLTAWTAPVKIQKAGGHHAISTTQSQHSMAGRDVVRTASLAEFRRNPEFAKNENPKESLYPPQVWDGPSWGMVLDLNSCVGCNACMTACQAENNIPVVGKKEVSRGRSMHWIRVDRYFEGDPRDPEIHFEPVTCMHCENAPCEPVCPAGATLHSKDGLNEMVYNRCVGTRYCLNNCPYKVRRFNFLEYSDLKTESLKPMRNPNVTVRERGVMEKCTYCVQRISAARITAKKENREIRDGEITTACQSACPAQAIVFGNINDPNSKISKLRALPLHYGLLVELNTRPHTTYLAKITNPGATKA